MKFMVISECLPNLALFLVSSYRDLTKDSFKPLHCIIVTGSEPYLTTSTGATAASEDQARSPSRDDQSEESNKLLPPLQMTTWRAVSVLQNKCLLCISKGSFLFVYLFIIKVKVNFIVNSAERTGLTEDQHFSHVHDAIWINLYRNITREIWKQKSNININVATNKQSYSTKFPPILHFCCNLAPTVEHSGHFFSSC